MADLAKRKIAEANAAMAAAAKCLKTGMFSRWKPDWEAAAAEYEKAATAYRVAKNNDLAIDAFVKASEAHERFDSGFMAAKHMETAAALAGGGSLRQPDKAAKLYERASVLHQEDARVENAAEALGKAARALEGVDAAATARGCTLAIAACDLYADDVHDSDVSEMRIIASLEAYKLAVPYLMRAGAPAKAAALLRRQALVHARLEQPHNLCRCELSAVVAGLAADDFTGAVAGCDAALARGDGFAGTTEAAAATSLIDAFSAQSADALAACKADQAFSFLDNQITLAVRGLTLASATAYDMPAPSLSLTAISGGGGGGGGGGDASGEAVLDLEPAVAAVYIAPEDQQFDDDDLC